MASQTINLSMSFTELAPYRRLATFLEQVESYADEQCDLALKELVDEAREDLLRLREARG